MIQKNQLQRLFGISPLGIIITILIWFVVYYFEIILKVPKMTINPTFRIALMAIFMIDALYLLIGGNYYLGKSGQGKEIAKQGPFQFIRHPIYSVWIFSFTGILAMIFYSWVLIFSAIPIAIIWSWLVQREEIEMLNKFGNEYISYMEQTGQFLPSWRAMKESMEEKK
ncbi:methyltransferase family protein [Candidatus Neomarinimicrobiota bacterium]